MSPKFEPRECRCCRKPIPIGMLACVEHWKMLPKPLRDAIIHTLRMGPTAAYVSNVQEADRLWQEAGLWQRGYPTSTSPGSSTDQDRGAS